VARFINAVYPYSGLRPSEFRLAHMDDIDDQNWTISVREPKEDGQVRVQKISHYTAPAVRGILHARTKKLKDLGVEMADSLIPAYCRGKVKSYFEKTLRHIIGLVKERMRDRQDRERTKSNGRR